ncbi:MAG: FHA domain-containing protein [Acidobacteriota bacterium]|nr:FHA domain-containing protein [Acidobacteriota bacterium]
MEQSPTGPTSFLRGLSSPIQDKLFPMTGDVIRIGRKEGIEVELKGNGISRLHAQIRRCDEGWELIDLKSTNGTYVNRKMVKSKILTHSDFIQIGDAELLYETEAGTDRDIPQAYSEDMSFYLIGLTDTMDGKTFPLEKETITIGRLDDNDIVISSKSISGYHAEVKIDHGSYFLIDLNSTNGTFLNGRKVEQTEIRAGDIIRINNFNFKVGCGDYKFAHTGTQINLKASDIPTDEEAVRELEEQQQHPSYYNLKTTGLYSAQEGLKEEDQGEPTAQIKTIDLGPEPQEKKSNRMVGILLGVIIILLILVAWLLIKDDDEQTGTYLEEPEMRLAAYPEEPATGKIE